MATFFQRISDNRFNEYIPSKPLTDLGFFRALSKIDV
jgi:hypothetical protein